MKNSLRSFFFFLISYGLFGSVLSGFAQDVSFGGPMNFAAVDGPDSVAVGDFNRDGNADLAVANADSNTVSIFLGIGDGSFGATIPFPVGNALLGTVAGGISTEMEGKIWLWRMCL